MPWKIEERDGEHCVIKEADGEVEGCHDTRDGAVAQLAALNAAEEKAGDEIGKETTWQPLTDALANFIADHIKQESPTKTEDGVRYPASDYAYVPDPDRPSTWKMRLSEGSPGNVTKAQLGRAAAAFSPGGFRGQKVQIPSGKVASVKAKIRAAYHKLGVDTADMPPAVKERELMVYKSGDTYRWAAIYSNNYRDNDNPPEIISKAAHEDFVRSVDDEEWPYPVLEWWHVDDMQLGQADLVFFDKSTGCAWAAGDFASKEIAEAFAGCGVELKVSHGMPTSEIERDESDPSVITRYRSKEISFLPARVAANPLTGIYNKEADMATKDEKLDELRQTTGLDPETVGAEKKTEADEQGRESKEIDASTAVTAEDVAAVLTPLVEQMDKLGEAVAELRGEVKELRESPPSPGASIISAMKNMSVIGKDEAQVDGRKARHEGPTETKADNGLFHSGNLLADSVIGPILDGSFARKMQKHLEGEK